jgi:hypothetical protein
MLDSTRTAKTIGLLAAAWFVVVPVTAVVLRITGGDRDTAQHALLTWGPWCYLAAAAVLLVDCGLGLRTRRISAANLSSHRMVAILLAGLTAFGLSADPRQVVPLVGATAVAVVLLLIPASRVASTASGAAGFIGGSAPVPPAVVEVNGTEVPVRWHLPAVTAGAPTPGERDPRAAWAVLGDGGAVAGGGPTSARIDYDPEVWLKSPYHPEEVDSWLQSAVGATTRRYAVAADSVDGLRLQRVLTEFVRRDVGTPTKLLRLGPVLGQAPLVATCSVLTGLPAVETEHVVESYPTERGYAGQPRSKVIDRETGLVRMVHQTSRGADDSTLSVRYHRRIDELSTDITVVCEGGRLVDASQALADLDALAASVTVLGADGRRR